MPVATPIRVGLIGYGFVGKTFHAPLITATPGLELVAVASSDAAKVHADLPQVTVVADPQALAVSDAIDLVVIASPNESHAPLAQAALHAGKDVVVDKPFTLTLAQARRLVALAQRKGRLLSVFHNRRWDSDFLGIRQVIEQGLLGTVTHFESHIDRFRPQVRDRWREGAGPGSGLWFDLGPHLVDQAIQLFGLPDRVRADLAVQREGGLSDDWAHVLLDYGTARVILHAGMLVAGGSRRFVVNGTGGSVIKALADPQEDQLRQGMRPGATGWGQDDDAMVFYDAQGERRTIDAVPGDQQQFYLLLRDALQGAGTNPVPPVQAVAAMAVIEAAARSARSGRPVVPRLTPAERAQWA